MNIKNIEIPEYEIEGLIQTLKELVCKTNYYVKLGNDIFIDGFSFDEIGEIIKKLELTDNIKEVVKNKK